MRKKENTDYYVHRHSCFLLQYHIVLVTKYRHPVLTGDVKDIMNVSTTSPNSADSVSWRLMASRIISISSWKWMR